MLFLRALLAFLVLPGMVTGLIPALIVAGDPRRGHGPLIAVVPLLFGMIVLLWCVRDFYMSGKGTLAPWDPPKRLVTVGLYQFTRNPMYVGVMLITSGWSGLAASPRLLVYTVFIAIVFHLRVVLYEEVQLKLHFPEEWKRYSATVPRWLPRLRCK
jgi:protein-S-isoprenylcysteine O-methyltransferase Ste14